MAFEDREKLDQVLNELVLEVQLWARGNFKYAMARSNIAGEISGKVISAIEGPIKEKKEENPEEKKCGGDVAELIFVMGKKPEDFPFLLNKITKLTDRYRKKYKIIVRPVFRWEEENGQSSASENRIFYVDSIIMKTYREG